MATSSTPRITIDTNCVIGLLDGGAATATSVEDLRELVRYAFSGSIQISVTTRVEVDFSRDKDADRRAEMVAKLGMFPIVGSVFRLDGSRLDDADMLVGPEQQGLWREVQRILFPGLADDSGKLPNKIADVDHLVGHKIAARDVFVTDDRGMLRRYDELRDGPGVLVMSPAECLRYVDGHVARHKPRLLQPERAIEGYRDSRLRGTVTFDYSNNDHRFTIGEGLNLFETRWSKASDTSIHAVDYCPSIEAIALAKGATSIEQVLDADTYDYSSRSRTLRTGQIVLWRNVNGIYAATKVLEIKDDSRGAEHDELTFDFVILPDGSTDFSLA